MRKVQFDPNDLPKMNLKQNNKFVLDEKVGKPTIEVPFISETKFEIVSKDKNEMELKVMDYLIDGKLKILKRLYKDNKTNLIVGIDSGKRLFGGNEVNQPGSSFLITIDREVKENGKTTGTCTFLYELTPSNNTSVEIDQLEKLVKW